MVHKKVKVSPKGRRLVERALRLHVDKSTSYFTPDSRTTLAESNAARNALTRRTRESKHQLLEYIAKLEEAVVYRPTTKT